MPSRRNRRNYYRILHVQPDAPGAVLKSSYRALMRTLEMHPDRGGEHWNAALINEAYGVLSDPVTRAEYDRTLDVAQLRNRPPRDRESESGPSAPRRPDPPADDGSDAMGCLFCGTANSRAGSRPLPELCRECTSPLTLAGAPQHEASGRRAARRVARVGGVRYFTEWPQPHAGEGRIVDLSPGGLRFETGAPIDIFQIIKLDGPVVDAVARVVTCRDVGRSFAIGVRFYTVRFHRDRGTFLSTSA